MTNVWCSRQMPDKKLLSKELVAGFGQHTESPTANHSLPKLTVITPSYNQAAFLERTIQSILGQQYPNLEYLVIDGGSTDGSVDLLKQYSSKITYWVSERDRGQAHAINKGLHLATGDYVAFQNSDDVYTPGAFWAVAQSIADRPSDIVYGNMLHIDVDDNVTAVQLMSEPNRWLQLFHGMTFHNQATFWRRDLIDKVGPVDESYQFCFDFDYFTRLMKVATSYGRVDRYLGAFRHHGDAKTSKLLHVAKFEHRAIQEEMLGRLSPLLKCTPGFKIAKAYRATWLLFHGYAWYLSGRRLA